MNEGYYFADVTLPFHAWVRERCAIKGWRWVLRDTTREGESNETAGLSDVGTQERDDQNQCARSPGFPAAREM